MHTDEYAISLSREINVCRSTIRRIRKSLATREGAYGMNTEAFLEKHRSAHHSLPPDAASAWLSEYEALTRWESLLREYEEVYRMMAG